MQWIPTFSLFLFLYPLGWLISHFSFLINKEISSNTLSIIGTIITFFLFILILPIWAQIRWKNNHLWLDFGFNDKHKYRIFKLFFNGFLSAFYLLFIFLIFLFVFGFVNHFGSINLKNILDATLLIIGIVLAEELIFRGWLMEEMILLFGMKRGIFFQSLIFSIAHLRFDIGFFSLIPFLIGLFLFGLVLTLRRIKDKGSLLGCIGLHGGLVAIWHIFESGMVTFSIHTPYYFLGPSKEMQNPIGSILGIIILLIVIFFQRRLFSRTGRFLAATVNASFKEEIP
tara:strand:- start:720 stop:1571 length:852 start_codon:yes stop_codon:yes gene_type:complete